ncbi:MAG: hypothetical protein IKT90_04920 [Clostridia bacterium]|nr:hypothetical protein [Clostridia bacterium]
MKQWRIWATVLMCCLLVFLIVGTWGMNQRLKLQEAREIYYALKHVSGVVSRMDEAKENEPIAFFVKNSVTGKEIRCCYGEWSVPGMYIDYPVEVGDEVSVLGACHPAEWEETQTYTVLSLDIRNEK